MNISVNRSLYNETGQESAVFMAYLDMARVALGLLTNSTVLYIFIVTPTLLTAFNVYLICLMCVNLFNLLGVGPLNIYWGLNAGMWTLGNDACSFLLYNYWAVFGCIIHIHLLIAMNRFWAVFWPVQYRQHHTKRLAVIGCISVIVYCHMINLPFILLDGFIYRILPLQQNGCTTNNNAQPVYVSLLMFGHFDTVIILDVIVCPIVLLKKLYIRKKRVTVTLGLLPGRNL